MSTAAWIAIAVTSLLYVLLLRLTVRLLAKRADNGWDNAMAYWVTSGLLAVGAGWLFGTGTLAFFLLAPLLCWIAQTVALKMIYEVKPLLAWLIGVTHAALTMMAVSTLTLTAGAIAAYILYGRIISDPMFLVRLILKLIGIELP